MRDIANYKRTDVLRMVGVKADPHGEGALQQREYRARYRSEAEAPSRTNYTGQTA
jgi:hypothetical protein